MPTNSKEYMREYMKNYMKNPKEAICEDCGHSYKSCQRYSHLKTQKHENGSRKIKEEKNVNVNELLDRIKKLESCLSQQDLKTDETNSIWV